MEDMIVLRRLRWLGHLARMDDHRLPENILFGWLSKRRDKDKMAGPCKERFKEVRH